MTSPKANFSAASNSTGADEIRKHYYLDRYVLIAPGRGKRPDDFARHDAPHVIPDAPCPFCTRREPILLVLPKARDWQIKVIANAYPAFTADNPKAFGAHEIIIETPNHNLEFSDLPTSQIELIFAAYRHRLTTLAKVRGVRYVLVFKNDGPAAGASIPHAHSQVMALPLVPPAIQEESDAQNHYRDEHASCALCDVLVWEEEQKVRVIAADKHFLAISPYAPDYAFEVWLLPRRHERSFTTLTSSELTSLAVIMKKLTARLDASSISFNVFLQESLPGQDHHFLIKIQPRIVPPHGGAELATGININPIPPEHAALWYNNKL